MAVNRKFEACKLYLLLYIQPQILFIANNIKVKCIFTALKVGLSSNFQNVDVTVIDCPDLTQKPFSLAGVGKF